MRRAALSLVLGLLACGQTRVEELEVDVGTEPRPDGGREASVDVPLLRDTLIMDTPPDAFREDVLTDVALDVGALDVGALDGGPSIVERALAVYYLDEAESGQMPSVLRDSQPNPVDLPLRFVGPSPQFQDSATGRHLLFQGGPGVDTGGGLAFVAGSKIDALHGLTEATLETVFSIVDCETVFGTEERIFGISDGNASTDGWLAVRVLDSHMGVTARLSGTSSYSGMIITQDKDTCPVRTGTCRPALYSGYNSARPKPAHARLYRWAERDSCSIGGQLCGSPQRGAGPGTESPGSVSREGSQRGARAIGSGHSPSQLADLFRRDLR